MTRYLYILVVSVLLLATMAFAQGRPGGMQGQGQGQGRSGAMGGQGGAMGPTATAGTASTPERQRIRATDQQRQQLRQCDQTMEQVRNQLREMARISRGQTITAQQTARWREQLRNQLQTISQQQESLRASLTQEQTSALADRLIRLQQDRERLETMSDALGFMLEAEQPDPSRVREQSQQMEKVANQVRTQQQNLGTDLGVDLP